MMRNIYRVMMLLAAAVTVPALADDLADAGADLYAEFCATCHGDDADGLQNFSDSAGDFVARLEGETDDMPDFTDFFDPEEVDAMYHFLNTLTETN